MSWALGFDSRWQRDVGYGVPALCDHPSCTQVINRGLSYVCGGAPYGGDKGCGLYFCEKHQAYAGQRCARCVRGRAPFTPKPDLPEWLAHKEKDASWAPWRKERDAHRLAVELAKWGATEPWVKDLVILRRAGPVRWTDAQLDRLKPALNSHGLMLVADAVGSLQYDKIGLENKLEVYANEMLEHAAQLLERLYLDAPDSHKLTLASVRREAARQVRKLKTEDNK